MTAAVCNHKNFAESSEAGVFKMVDIWGLGYQMLNNDYVIV
jgi:hypothetical protein